MKIRIREAEQNIEDMKTVKISNKDKREQLIDYSGVLIGQAMVWVFWLVKSSLMSVLIGRVVLQAF